MSFIETVERARTLLERNGRLSMRALQLEFELDAEAVEALAEELVDVQQVASRQGKILSWIGQAPLPSHQRQPERAPRDYTPKHLADKILRSRSALEGERKHVTVLFADVKNSMELSGRVEAEAWHGILDRFFGILNAGVHRFEGTVNQYTGDGIMALFGAPIAHEDHAQRACYAALHLRETLDALAEELRLSRGLDFAVRMGLHTGEVVVGSIGDDLRMDYTAQGQSVGLAQRLEQLAPARSVYLSEATAQLVSGYVELRDLGDERVKGLAEPVRVFELVALGSHRTRLDVARSRGLTRFVGRTADLQTLDAALDQACAGNGQVVGVVAEAGVGKSRLCLEFVEQCRARGIRVDGGHCPSHGETIPYLPLLELLRSVFGIDEHDSAVEARRQIEGAWPDLDEGFRPLLPLLFDLLGIADPERPTPPLPPELRERQLSAFLRHLVRERSEREPGVLLIDDAHWIDSGSDAFLSQMVEAVPGTRTLVVVNFRPEYHADWMERSHYRQLPLLPLGREATQELLVDLLGPHPSLADLAEAIHEHTGGNPFFVEEVVLSLIEGGQIEGEKGAYQRVAAVGKLAIPNGVRAVLAARSDRLPEREKRLLQTASVIGREFSGALLERVAKLSESDLSSALSALVRREFVFEKAQHLQAEYTFKHPLTHEVAYGSQLAEGRAQTHASVARALEELHPDHLDEQAALLAYHWEHAGELLVAARWNLRAAKGMEFVTDASASKFHWGRAQALLAAAPETEERDRLELDVCSQMVMFQAWQGTSEAMNTIFARGCALAETLGERRSLAQLHVHYGVWRGFTCNDVADFGRHVRQAADLADLVGDAGIALAAGAGLALSAYMEGRLAEAIAIGWRTLERAPDIPNLGAEYWSPSPALWLRGFTLSMEAWAGHPKESFSALQDTHSQAQSQGMELLVGITSLWSGQAAELLGDAESVAVHAREVEAMVDRAGVPFGGADHYYHGIAHLIRGDAAAAVASLERARDVHEETLAAPIDVVGSWSRLAVAYAESGRAALARKTAARGVELTRERLPAMTAQALTFQARVLRMTLGAEARDAIEAALTEAEALVERMGFASWQPFIQVEWAEIAHLTGDAARCERERREALRLFDAMGAARYADEQRAKLDPHS